MNFTPVHGRAIWPLAVLLVSAGCATTQPESPPPGAIIIDGDKYVTLDAPVGSHMKRRVKISELKDPTISPTEKKIVTANTDTLVLPPTASDMQRSMSGIGR